MEELYPEIKSFITSKKVISLENITLIIAGAGIAFFILTQIQDGLYPAIIVGSVVMLFILEKTLLGDSLSLKYITIPSFFMVTYIMVLALPSILLYFDMDHPIRATYLLAIQSILITFPIGVFLANLLVLHPNMGLNKTFHGGLTRTPRDLKLLPLYIFMLLSSIPILFLYFYYSEYVPLLEIIKAYPTDISSVVLRFSENDLPKLVHFCYEILRRFILPLCLAYTYFMSYLYKGVWKFLFIVIFLFALVISSLTLDRATPISLFIMIILSYLLARNKPIVSVFKGKLVAILIVALLLGGFISVSQYQTDFSFGLALSNSWYVFYYRLFYSPALMASYAFENFNYDAGFLYGNHIRLFSMLPGIDYVESLESGPFVAAPVTFVGDLWRQWGWIGVIIGGFLIGFIFQLIQLLLFSSGPKTVSKLSVNLIMLVGSIWIIYGNVLGIMSTSVLAIGILLGIINRRWQKDGSYETSLFMGSN